MGKPKVSFAGRKHFINLTEGQDVTLLGRSLNMPLKCQSGTWAVQHPSSSQTNPMPAGITGSIKTRSFLAPLHKKKKKEKKIWEKDVRANLTHWRAWLTAAAGIRVCGEGRQAPASPACGFSRSSGEKVSHSMVLVPLPTC